MINIRLVKQGETVMSKGSSRRKQEITDKQLQDAWDRIFKNHPKEDPEENKVDDGYGNIVDKDNAKG